MTRPHRGNSDQVDRLAERLRSIPLFSRVPESTLADVADRSRCRTLDRDAVVFVAGQPAESVHVLLSGHIKVVHETEDGQEVILRIIQPGEIFGGAGGWGDEVYPATGLTLGQSTFLQMPAGEFTSLVESHPTFALAVVAELGRRLREAEMRIRELQAERVQRRIARTLLRLASKTGKRTEAGIEIDLPLSRQNLAELAGTTLSTVSRTLSAWHRDRLIDSGRERVILLRAHDLVEIAEDLDDDWHGGP